MGYLAALMLLMLFAVLSSGGTQTLDLNELAQGGAQVFRVIAYGQIILVCLLAPLLMAAALGNEQQNETYEILLTTPLSSAQIVLGALVGRWFFIASLLLSGLPLFAVLLLFGGVPLTSVFVAFGVALATGLFVGSVAVTISVFRLGGRRTVFGFVIAVAGYLVGAYALDLLLLRRLGTSIGTTTWLTPLHPLLVLESVVQQVSYAPPTPAQLLGKPELVQWYRTQPVPVFMLLSFGGSVFLMLLSALALRPVSQGQWAWMRSLSELLAGKSHRPGRTVGKHAIAWRETHARSRGLLPWVARLGYLALSGGLAAVLIAAYHTGSLPQITTISGNARGVMPAEEVFQGALMVLLLIQVAVLALIAIYVSAASVSKEREDGTLDLILTTPVTPKQYIWGKLHGLVRSLVVLVFGPVVTLGVIAGYSLIGVSRGWASAQYSVAGTNPGAFIDAPLALPESPVLMVLFLAPFVAACAAFGMSRSLVSKTVIGAVGQSIGMAGVLVLILGVCGYSAANSIPVLGPILNAMSPATSLFMLVDPWSSVAGFPENPVAGRIAMLVGAAISAAIYGLIVYSMVLAMVRSFDHSVRKLSGR